MQRFMRLVLATLIAAGLAACGGGGGGGGGVGNANAGADAGFMWVLNLVSDSPTLGLEVDGETAALASYGDSTRRLAFSPGPRRVSFSATVQPGNQLQTLSPEVVVELAAGEEALVVLYGTMDDLRVDVWENDATDRNDGSGRVGLLSYSTRQPAIDLYLTGETEEPADTAPTASASAPGFDGLVFPNAGQYELELTVSGEPAVLYNAGLVDIAADSSSYFVAIDYFTADPDAIVVLEVAGEAARLPLLDDALPFDVRFINGIADYSAVDLYLGDTTGEPELSNVAFRQDSGYLQLESTPSRLIVTPAGVKNVIFYERQFDDSSAGFQDSLVTSGLSTQSSTTGQLVFDNLRRIADIAQLDFVHASSSNDRVDAYLLSPGETTASTQPIVMDLEYLMPNDGYPAVPGDYTIVITPAGSTSVLLGPLPVTLAPGDIVDFVLFDSEGGGLPGSLEEYRY